ncbi:MAG TPA: SMP-30/gluconolactonase/LRE family protein [Verrucomicrobiae bacterium]|nr:SMP-30/gluconolactonase/LRE family protein [Verrucomicrobiae bacterium]
MARAILAACSLLCLTVTLAVTSAVPGTVTTIVNPSLFTKPHGEEHLHGIVRDPITGNIYVADWNLFSVGNTPFFGPYIENKDSVRAIDALKEVSVLTYVIAPNGMAYDPTDRRIYVAVGTVSCGGGSATAPGPALNGIVSIDPATGKATVLSGGKPGSENGSKEEARYSEPAGIVYDPGSGSFFVSEPCANRIRQVDANGDAGTLAGSGTAGHADGSGAGATFDYPRGIAYCEHEHTLYVADRDNNEIRAVSLQGTVTTLAGAPEAGFADGKGTSARFDHPTGVACDNAGNVYVADSQNNAIRQIDASGTVTTLAGGRNAGTADGVGAAASFSTPGDLMYDPVENALFVVDWGSNSIRKIAVAAPGT